MNLLQSTAGITAISLCGSDISEPEDSVYVGRSVSPQVPLRDFIQLWGIWTPVLMRKLTSL